MHKFSLIIAFAFLLVFAEKTMGEEAISLPQDDDTSGPQDANSFTESEEAPKVKTEVKRPNKVTIDLSECTCTRNSGCDLTILKSPLMDITCGEEESLCCPMTKSDSQSEENLQSDSQPEEEVAPRSNVRVYSITPAYFQGLDSSADKYLAKKTSKSKKCGCKLRSSCPQKYVDYSFGFYCTYNTVRCCIPEDDNSDISVTVVESEKVQQPAAVSPNATQTEMGNSTVAITTTAVDDNEDEFMIAVEKSVENSTVLENGETGMPPLATEAEGAMLKEDALEEQNASISQEGNEEEPTPHDDLSGDGELVIKEVTSWTELEEDDYQKEAECYCLPLLKCQQAASYDSNNMIERRRDTLCPGDLIQCCGRNLLEEITKKRDEVVGEYDMQTQHNIPEVPQQTAEVLPEETNFEYPTPFNFPGNNDTALAIKLTVPTSTQNVEPPKVSSILPEPYPGYQPPGFYKGYGQQQQQQQQPANVYPSSQPATNNQYYGNGQQYHIQPHAYEGTGGQTYTPWLYSKYTPQGAYPVGNTYTEGETPRHTSGGLFDTLTKFLG